jgi:hypothetical protein
MAGPFKYEDDLLKHYVRINGWLPLCRGRRERLQARAAKLRRRLRYFTFCAVNAVDVLMLDVANVLTRSTTDRFDTVYFFDRTPDLVAQTQLRIPGSIGFVGSFVETVLAAIEGGNPLDAPATEQDTVAVRKSQTLRATKQDFVASFPFDVLNLDLQDYIFRAKDTIPGDVMRALRRVCEWQRNPLATKHGPEYLDGFTLLFTTRIGPAELHNDYAAMLLQRLELNVHADDQLTALLNARNGLTVAQLQGEDFDAFFELSVPKVIVAILMEEDWYVEPQPGILAFRFTRNTDGDPYTIVHFAMDVRRQVPPRDQRAPGTGAAPDAVTAYRDVVRALFQTPAVVVTDATAAAAPLTPSLDQIRARRRKYFPDEMG